MQASTLSLYTASRDFILWLCLFQAYRRGAEHLMKLRDCSSIFLPVFGLTITSPVRIIFKTMPEGRGSLLQRLRGKDGPPLNLLQLGSVLKQLSSCLCDLVRSSFTFIEARSCKWSISGTCGCLCALDRGNNPSECLFVHRDRERISFELCHEY